MTPEAKAVMENARKRAQQIMRGAELRAEKIERTQTRDYKRERADAAATKGLTPMRIYYSPTIAAKLRDMAIRDGLPAPRLRVWDGL